MAYRFMVMMVCGCAALQAAPDFSALDATVEMGLKRTNTPGAAIAIVMDGKVVFSKGYGVANVDTGERVRPEMLFRLGSTTKMFTAATAASLVEEGKLDYGAPVGKLLPEVNPKLAQATLRQLLSHTAGLGDMTVMEGLHDDSALAQNVRDISVKLHFTEPGEIFSYSNPGYWVVGRLIEQASGKFYADEVNRRILQPLGMTRSTMRPTQAMTWPLAVGHGPEGSGQATVTRPLADNAGGWPAGQLFSSAPEFARFCIAMMDGGKLDGKQAIPPAVVTALTTPAVRAPGGDRQYGYGLFINREQETTWWSHNGSRTGYGSLVQMAPERHYAMVILCNRTGQSLPRVAEQAAEIALGIKRTVKAKPAAQPLTPEEVAALAGVYSSGSNRFVMMRNDDGLKWMGRKVVKLADDRLQLAGGEMDQELVIVRNSQGRVEYLCRQGRALKKQ